MESIAFSFPVLGVPVRVTSSSLLYLALMMAIQVGSSLDGAAVAGALLFGVVIFVSVLIHELGHAVSARRFGLQPREIILHAFGGVCVFGRRPGPLAGVVTSFAGPLAGFVLAAVSFGGLLALEAAAPSGGLAGPRMLLNYFVLVNVFLSAFNLLPVHPLDGGAMLAHGLLAFLPPVRAWAAVYWTGMVVGIPAAVAAWMAGFRFMAILLAFTLFQNFQRRP